MSGIISKPKMPEVKQATPTVVDETRAVEDERKRLASRQGRAANILTEDYRQTTGKTLLGQ